MAQALFDEHPLGDYLRDNGETPLLIPGIYPALEQELVDFDDGLDANSGRDHKELPRFLLDLIEFLQSAISSAHADIPSPFVEKYKYNVISSSLLSRALSSPYSRRSSSLSLPGKLVHSRASSMDLGHSSITPVPPSEPSYGIISLSTASAAALFSTGYPFLALIAFIVTLLLVYNFVSTTDLHQSDMTTSLEALDDLIQANQVWESVVQDALNVLESDERTSFLHNSPNSPLTPSHVRVALHSCLQTTHTQCDNIRNIFSALTCPAELSQLSEMYAPQSLSKRGVDPESLHSFSFPHSSPPPSFTAPNNKRATWNGSYTSLASAGSPTHSHRRRHRGGLPVHFGSSSNSAPATPNANSLRSNTLPDFLKQSSAVEDNSIFTSSESNHFGVAALELQRKRKTRALEAFQYLPSSNSCGTRNGMFVSTSAASKFTSHQPSRHPLSLSALKCAVQNAVAAKRYTSSHLLALRFSDEEDEGYWEDVKSVMGLLTSTLVDVSSRLSEVLDEAEQQNLQDQIPSPFSMLPSSDDENIFTDQLNQNSSYKSLKTDGRVSFAPMPNHISRFAAHVAAITSALDDARDNLDQCISALKEDSSGFPGSFQPSQRSRNIPKTTTESAPEEAVPVALQAYERLRRELGLALRECERGRDRLLEIVNPPAAASDEEESDDLPSLLLDVSDKTDSISPNPEDESDMAALINDENVMVGRERGGDVGELLIDDVTSHLLLTATTKHLPMPGIEEVYEADMGSRPVFARERPKLTREERIKAAKARRESGLGIAFVGGGDGNDGVDAQKMGGIEKWGPGGEVVQELKDVIWKVSEKKRKMADASQAAPQSA